MRSARRWGCTAAALPVNLKNSAAAVVAWADHLKPVRPGQHLNAANISDFLLSRFCLVVFQLQLLSFFIAL